MDNMHDVEQAYADWYNATVAGQRTQEWKFKHTDGREFSINFEESRRVPALLRTWLTQVGR